MPQVSNVSGSLPVTTSLKSAEAFLEALWKFHTGPFRPIYRGVADANWDLKPSALRPDGLARLTRIGRLIPTKASDDPLSAHTRALIEFKALSLFYRFANNQSLTLPQASDEWHHALLVSPHLIAKKSFLNLMTNRVADWPPQELRPLIGLAQHYGVPTRLLDWSTDCYVAAYFAAKSSILRTPVGADPDLCVWFAPRDILEATSLPFKPAHAPVLPYRIDVIEVPYAGNPNLAAQKGVFTLVTPAPEGFDQQANLTTVDQALAALRESSRGHLLGEMLFKRNGTEIPNPFFKITLPASQAKKLLKLLHDRGYDGSRLFPGYKGAEIAIQEMELISEPNG